MFHSAPLFAPDSDEDAEDATRPPLKISDSDGDDFSNNVDSLTISSTHTKPTCRPVLYKSSTPPGKDSVYINVFGGGMPGCYMEWCAVIFYPRFY